MRQRTGDNLPPLPHMRVRASMSALSRSLTVIANITALFADEKKLPELQGLITTLIAL